MLIWKAGEKKKRNFKGHGKIIEFRKWSRNFRGIIF
jgi:hypothetical protein